MAGRSEPRRKLAPTTVAALDALGSMWTAIDQARERAKFATLSQRPENGFTLAEYAEQYRIPRPTASHQLRRMVDLGELQQCFVSLPDVSGRLHRTAVYFTPQTTARK